MLGTRHTKILSVYLPVSALSIVRKAQNPHGHSMGGKAELATPWHLWEDTALNSEGSEKANSGAR